jgi:hypothetical protein
MTSRREPIGGKGIAATAQGTGWSLPPFSQGTIREEKREMPLYMDIHNHIPGLTREGVIDAHARDLAVQDKYGVKFLRYWYDQSTGKVFCLFEAPSKEAAMAAHGEAHGALADEIVEVSEGE